MRVDRDLTATDLKETPPPDLPLADRKRWNYQRYMRDYLAYLDRSGLAANTLVVHTWDQGFLLGDHGWFDKRFRDEEALRMPLPVRWPQFIRPGTTADAMVLDGDFAPTFLAVAGRPIPAAIQGRSALPLLRGERPADWRTAMDYRSHPYPQDHRVQPHQGIRTERHKRIDFSQINQWERFDLATDPHELDNLIAAPAQAALSQTLKAELARLRADLQDTDQFDTEVPGTGVEGPPVKS